MKALKVILGALVLVLVCSAVPVAAPNLSGSFNVTFYLEPNHTLGATQCVVFTVTGGVVGEPLSGTWTSPTFAGWHGQWIQEGDHLRFYGVTSSLGTSEFGLLIFANQMAGEFVHFSKSTGVTSTAGSFRATKVSACRSAAPGAVVDDDPAK